jgi:hypothetical protein
MTIQLDMNEKDLPKEPSIIMANYPTNYIEYFAQALFGHKVCILVHAPAVKVLKYLFGEEHLIPVEKGDFSNVEKHVAEKLKNGYHVFCYIERDYYNRKRDYQLTELRSGMFRIAKNLGTTITPVVIDHIDHVYGIIERPFQIRVGKTQNVDNVDDTMKNVGEFFTNSLRRMEYHLDQR